MIGGSLLKLLPVAAVSTAAAGGPQELMDMAEAALGATLSVKTESEMRNIVHVMRLDIIADERLPRNDRELAEYIEYNIDTQEQMSQRIAGERHSVSRLKMVRESSSPAAPIHAAGPTMTSGEPSSTATAASANRSPRKLVFPI